MMNDVKKIVERRIEGIRSRMEEKGYQLEYAEKITVSGKCHGIEVSKNERKSQIGAIVYYDETWEEKNDTDLINQLIDCISNAPDIDIDHIMKREYILDNVQPMIMDINHIDFAKDSPFFNKITENFILFCYVPIVAKNDVEIGISKIKKTHLEKFDISEAELVNQAYQNAKTKLWIGTIYEVMKEMLLQEDDEDMKEIMENMFQEKEATMPMYIVTNQNRHLGAGTILLPETYQILSKRLGEKFIILPSSIHECIAIEYTEDYEQLVEMVTSINDSIVDPNARLSDHVYLYSEEGISLLK